ncbi:hypothetical protein N4R57_09390 [Rhodobacteraceae bacterium D3-12]|nr:hypothetical protein N4R57_09390 [Rhodobacteraceae bacterium D3-12]
MITTRHPLRMLELGIGFDGQNGPFMASTMTPHGVTFGELNTALVRQLAPSHVTSWLFCEAYDVYDVARILSAAEFGGTYTALAAYLPKKALVKREVQTCFPRLCFDIKCPGDVTGAVASYHNAVANPAPYVDERPGLALA